MADSKFSDARALGPTWRQRREKRAYDDATDVMLKLLKRATAAEARATAAEARAKAALARAIAAEAALEKMEALNELNNLDDMLYGNQDVSHC